MPKTSGMVLDVPNDNLTLTTQVKKHRRNREPAILKYLERRRHGTSPYLGNIDRLNKSLANKLLDIPVHKHSTENFEYSTSPFYRTEIYRKGKFHQEYRPIGPTGGIYNLEFSPDGRILSAACERRNILIFDPLTRKVVKSIELAHQDCVNCVRFLDTRTFASCSDDTTVVLWDVRNLKSRVRTLQGHSNWVKNIEYSQHNNALVTSGFDGAIYTWDFNEYSENRTDYRKVFYTNGLMRMRLTPDASKMVISTRNGYLVVVHDLDLDTMSEDLAGFKPNLYRLMQISGKAYLAVNYTRLFHAKRNRIELISDFPAENDAEIISSLRLHPQGWVATSRNTSSDDKSEWCCVHNIQSIATNEEDDKPIQAQTSRTVNWSQDSQSIVASSSGSVGGRNDDQQIQQSQEDEEGPSGEGSRGFAPIQRFTTSSGRIEIISTGMPMQDDSMSNEDEEDDNEEDEDDTENAEEIEVDGENFIAAESLAALDFIGELARETRDAVEAAAASTAEQPAGIAGPSRQADDSRVPGGRSTGDQQSSDEANDDRDADASGNTDPISRRVRSSMSLGIAAGGGLINILGVGPNLPPSNDNRTIRNERGGFYIIGGNGGENSSRRVLYFGSPAARRAQFDIPADAKVHKNTPRLTHYIEESNTGRGFIKEQCFSHCGRFIASPFGFGVRLLGWNENCSDLSDCVPQSAVPLYEIGMKSSHTEVVLSSAFSPFHWMLVTGCLAGRVSWHQPAI